MSYRPCDSDGQPGASTAAPVVWRRLAPAGPLHKAATTARSARSEGTRQALLGTGGRLMIIAALRQVSSVVEAQELYTQKLLEAYALFWPREKGFKQCHFHWSGAAAWVGSCQRCKLRAATAD